MYQCENHFNLIVNVKGFWKSYKVKIIVHVSEVQTEQISYSAHVG